MNTLEHIKDGTKRGGIEHGLLSVTPDIMMLIGKYGVTEAMKRFGRNHHNTEQGISRFNALSPKLGQAALTHAEQDEGTHDFDYEYEFEPLEPIPNDSVLLMSAGLDSFAAWRLLGEPKAVYFAIGHKAEEKEIEMLEKIREDFDADITIDRTLTLADEEMANGYIPYRNLYFLMLATKYSPDVVLSQIAEWAPDKNKKFYKKATKLLSDITTGSFQGLETRNLEVHTPLAKYTKSQVVDRYIHEFGSADDLLKYTTSCYSNTNKPCGECTSCASRHLAMTNNGIEEEYETLPSYDDFMKKVSVKDFRFGNSRMYFQRWLEGRGAK